VLFLPKFRAFSRGATNRRKKKDKFLQEGGPKKGVYKKGNYKKGIKKET